MSKKKTKSVVSKDGSKGVVIKKEPPLKGKKKTKKSKKPVTAPLSPSRESMLGSHTAAAVADLISEWAKMAVHEPGIVYRGPNDSNATESKDAKPLTAWDALGLETKRDIYTRFNDEFRNYYSMLYSYDKMNYIMNVIDNAVNDDLLMDFKFNKQKAINRVHRVVATIEGL